MVYKGDQMAVVLAINISDKTGVVKHPVDQAEFAEGGIKGDAHFGLSDIKQVSLLADESVDKMRALGLSLDPGELTYWYAASHRRNDPGSLPNRQDLSSWLRHQTADRHLCHANGRDFHTSDQRRHR
jgi:hypothetical protein